MSDGGTPWAAPGGAPGPAAPSQPPPAQPGQPVQPRYGEFAPPGWAPPQPQQPPQRWGPPQPFQQPAWGLPPGYQPGWTPPPRPGLIPLRPLTLGDVTGGAFRVIRRNPRPTFGFALVISLAIGLVVGGLIGLLSWLALSRIGMASSADADAIRAGSILLVVLTTFLGVMIQLAVSSIPQGVVAYEVSRAALGEKRRLGELWRGVRGRIWALIGWTFLLGGGFLLLAIIVILPVAALAIAAGPQGIGLSIGLSLLGAAGLVVASVWLGTKLEFVPALILIERLSIGAAMRRSWTMMRGHFWRVFGITLLVNVIISFAAQLVSAPISFLGTLASSVFNPNQSVAAVDTTAIVIVVVTAAVGIVVSAITMVAQSAVPTLLYIDVRMRREGFDLTLQRWAEADAAGQNPPDPYR